MPALINGFGDFKPTLTELLTTLLFEVVVTGKVLGELPIYKLYCFQAPIGVEAFALPSISNVSLGVTGIADLYESV